MQSRQSPPVRCKQETKRKDALPNPAGRFYDFCFIFLPHRGGHGVDTCIKLLRMRFAIRYCELGLWSKNSSLPSLDPVYVASCGLGPYEAGDDASSASFRYGLRTAVWPR